MTAERAQKPASGARKGVRKRVDSKAEVAKPPVDKAPGRGKYDRTSSPVERVREQRRRLFMAATHVFATRGLALATVEDVCSASGISRRTFYEHFKDIRHIFVELYDRLSKRSFTAVEMHVGAQEHPHLQLRAGIEALLGLVAHFPNESLVMFREVRLGGPSLETRRDAMLQRFAKLLHEGVARSYREGVCTIPPDDIRVYALAAGIEAVAMRTVEQGEPARAMEALEPLVDMVRRSFDGRLPD